MRTWIVAAVCLVGLGCGTDEDDPERLGPVPVPRVTPGGGDDGSGDDGDDVGDPDFALDATPEDLVIPQGGTAVIAVHVDRIDGFDEPIEVTVDGLPDGIAATPLTLGPTETSGDIALAAPSTMAIPERTSARVRGHAETGTRSDQIQLRVRGEAGAFDTSFDSDGAGLVMRRIFDVDVQGDGKILLAGWYADASTRVACRLDADGALDESWADGGCVSMSGTNAFGVEAITQAAGAVVVVGMVDQYTVVTRLLPDGQFDPAFAAGGLFLGGDGVARRPYAAIGLDDGSILMTGMRNDGYSDLGAFLAHVRADGTLDPDFGDEGQTAFAGPMGTDLARFPDGRIVVLTENGSALHAFDAAGHVDTTFGDAGRAELLVPAHAISRVGDRIACAGDGLVVTFVDGAGDLLDFWGPISPEGDDVVTRDIVVRGDGSIVFAGGVWSFDGGRVVIVRRDESGAFDDGFGVGTFAAGSEPADLEVLHDGRYLVGGTRDGNYGVLLRAWN